MKGGYNMRKIALLLVTTVLLTFASELDYDITRVKTVSDVDYIPSLAENLERTIHFFDFNEGHGYVDMSKVIKWLETFESLEEAIGEGIQVRQVPIGGFDIEAVRGSEYVPTVIGYFEEALKMIEDVKIGPFDEDEEDEKETALQERQEFISIWKEAVNSLAEFKYAVSLDKDVYLRRKYAADYEREELPGVTFSDSLFRDHEGDSPLKVGDTIGTAVATGPESTTLKIEVAAVTRDAALFVKYFVKRVEQGTASDFLDLERLQWLGFKKLILTDGEQTWSWDL